MSETWFVLKTIVLSFVVIAILKIDIGNGTIEHRTLAWVDQAAVAQPLQEVVQGGVKVVREGWKKITSLFNSSIAKDLNFESVPGSREIGIQLKRSQKFVNEQAQKLKDKASSEKSELSSDDVEWNTEEPQDY